MAIDISIELTRGNKFKPVAAGVSRNPAAEK
jgi:hypothetical protein